MTTSENTSPNSHEDSANPDGADTHGRKNHNGGKSPGEEQAGANLSSSAGDTDFFEAIDIDPQKGKSASQSEEAHEDKTDADATDSHTKWFRPVTDVAPKAVGANSLLPMESELEEVIEASEKLMHVVDGLTEDTAENVHAAILDYVSRARHFLAEWEVSPPANEAERLNRLASLQNTAEDLDAALDDLKLLAVYLTRVRPEQVYDLGTWSLIRRVRKGMRSVALRELAEVCRDLSTHLEDQPRTHLLAPYLPRLESRYDRAVRNRVNELEPSVSVDADSAEPADLIAAMLTLEPLDAECDEFHSIYPHPEWERLLGLAKGKREQFLPALTAQVESAAAHVELPALVLMQAALAEVPETTRTHEDVAPLKSTLGEALEAVLAEVRAAAESALVATEPAPVWQTLQRMRTLPDVLREPGSEMGELERRLEEHLQALLEALGDEVDAALTSLELADVDAALARLEQWAQAAPEGDGLAARLEELRAHKQRLVEQRAREREVTDLYEALAAEVRAALADASTTVPALEVLLEKVAAQTQLDEDMRNPLREDLERRRLQLLALQAAVEAQRSEASNEARGNAEATLTAHDREVLAEQLATAKDHADELAEIEAHRTALAEFQTGLATTQDADEHAATGEPAVEAALGFLAEPGAEQPGAAPVRDLLRDELEQAQQTQRNLHTLAGLRKAVRKTLGEISKVPNTEAPPVANAHQRVEDAAERLAPTLEQAPYLAASFNDARTDWRDLHAALDAWMQDIKALRAGIKKGELPKNTLAAGEQAAERAAQEAERVGRLDDWLQSGGDLSTWLKRHVSALRHEVEQAEELAEARRLRAARRRRTLAVAAVVLLLVGAGVAATLWWLEEQRKLRADELYAAGKELRDEPSEDTQQIAAWLGEADEFLDEQGNEEDYGERFEPLHTSLVAQKELVAEREAELAELRERLEAKEARLDEFRPAESPFPLLTTEVQDFRDRALERQAEEVESLRLRSREGHARVLARPGLEAQRIPPVDAALDALTEEVAAEEDPPFAERAAPLIAQLEAHRAQLARAAAVEALVAEGEEALESRQVPQLQAFVSRGDAFLEEEGDAPPANERLVPLVDEARELAHSLVARAERFDELVAAAEAALESGELTPLREAHHLLDVGLAEREWATAHDRELRTWRERVGLAWLDALIARGLTAESAEEIAEVESALERLLRDELATEVAAAGQERVEAATPRLAHRRLYFEHLEAHDASLAQALATQDSEVESVRTRQRQLREANEELVAFDTSRDAFGEPPPAQDSLRDKLEVHGERVMLLERAEAALALRRAAEVEQEVADIRAALAAANERAAAHEATHQPSLTPPLELLERYAALLAQAEAGLQTETHEEAEAAHEELVEAMEAPENELLQEPAQPARERLAQHVASLEDPWADVELTLDVSERTAEDILNATGTVRGGREPLERVHLYTNGNHQQATVRNNTFESVLVLRGGDNTIIVSPVQDPEHPRAVEYSVFSTAERAAVQVTLTWNKDNTDLDLHVDQPNGETIYYRNRRPPGFNGYLDHDNTTGYGPENYRFRLRPGQQLPEGDFDVYVVYFSGREPVDFEITFTLHPGLPEEEVRQFTGKMERENSNFRKPVFTFTINEEGNLAEVKEADDD